MESTDLRGPQRCCRVRSAARVRPSASAAIGLALAVTLLGCASAPMPSAAHQQSDSMASSPAKDSTRTVSASRSPAIGQAYAFELLIHCGVPIVDFGGQAWQPIAPVPAYPGPRLVNGTATYTGYVAGTMTLVSARRLLFVADSSAVASPFSVVYEPLTGRSTRSPCSLRGRTRNPGAPGMNDRRQQSARRTVTSRSTAGVKVQQPLRTRVTSYGLHKPLTCINYLHRLRSGCGRT
jgi:hypothetical protein